MSPKNHNSYKMPALRFPDFADDWQLKKIGALTERVTNPVDVQDDKLYSQIGIRSHGKGIFYKEAVTGKSLGNKRVFWVKENTFIVNIVFAWEQAVAKTTEKELGMIASHRFPMYSPVETQSDLDYLLQFFLTRKGKSLLELASPGGAGRNKTLGQKEFENLKFLVPNVAEQTKIASFITAIDQKIAQLKQKKTLLEKYKKGVMQKLFSQELRFKPALSEVEGDENGKEFPKWEKKKLGELCEIVGGGTPETNKKEYWNGDIQWFTPTEIKSDFVTKSIRKITELGLQKSSAKKLPIGTILLTTRATIGEAAIAMEECTTNQGFQSLIVKEGNNNIFLFNWIKENEHELVSRANGSTFPEISKSEIEKISLMIPSLPEQTKIANFLSAIDEKINRTQNQIQQTGQYKKGLLQNMFV